MELGPDLVQGTFLERLNRFAARVEVEGKTELVHVANSGRMHELLVPGYRVWLKYQPGEHRKTRYDLALVDTGFCLASADARLPNALVREALSQGRLPQFTEYTIVKPESTYGESRLDFLLEKAPGQELPRKQLSGKEEPRKCYVETKSVTLVEDGLGLFPDAPTSRGVKHLHSLVKALGEGYRAAVIFVIQREDVQAFSSHDTADPEFALVFRQALAAGVEAFAHRCLVTHRQIELAGEIPIELKPLALPD
ncbi:MAG: hypothetical protein BZY88_09305 [SAR202 cluster bacterium Io17-Chloro-G9]|nr:MAG: hypothetical protein BZY88_09305 [SAR202 cluster bacterium Io17-Chloro-G9]